MAFTFFSRLSLAAPLSSQLKQQTSDPPTPTKSNSRRRKAEDRMAMLFVAIVTGFLLTNFPRILLNFHEILVFDTAMECSSKGFRYLLLKYVFSRRLGMLPPPPEILLLHNIFPHVRSPVFGSLPRRAQIYHIPTLPRLRPCPLWTSRPQSPATPNRILTSPMHMLFTPPPAPPPPLENPQSSLVVRLFRCNQYQTILRISVLL
jgi:hypothetical protein